MQIRYPTLIKIMRTVAFAFVIARCSSNNNKVRLEIDFSGRPQWKYLFRGELNGSIKSEASQKKFSSIISCTLVVKNSSEDKSLIFVRADSLKLTADFLKEAEIENFRNQLESASITFTFCDGVLTPAADSDNVQLPLLQIGYWDLWRNLLKAIPALPKTKISKGFSWERQWLIPLETNRGPASGHLYQIFVCDSLPFNSKGERLAFIEWRFSQLIDPSSAETDTTFIELPMRGSGKGRCCFNTTQKYLEWAKIEFSIDDDNNTSAMVDWSESVELTLLQQ